MVDIIIGEEDDIRAPAEGSGFPACATCAYFEITWDRSFPRACKFFGFKGQHAPALEVQKTTGEKICPAFLPKHKNREPE